MNPATRPVFAQWPEHRTVWRWHFYAGLFCIPFVLWLAITGSIYLFKPQVEAWLDRPFDHLTITGPRAAPSAQIAAALAAVPGARFNAYELPPSTDAAVRVLVGRGAKLARVYVHPQTLAILRAIDEDDRLMAQISHLHGELMLGDRGSMLVELAASWAIVMLLTGLYLWWPRNAVGMAGVVYPRVRRGSRIFWRDLHAVIGLWVSFLALFLLISGLPWAKSWGGLLKEVRRAASPISLPQDWTSGRSDELAQRLAANTAADRHHHGDDVESHADADADSIVRNYEVLDRLVGAVAARHLAAPVLISPPSQSTPAWTARSDAQNRLLRTKIVLDPHTGAVLNQTGFADRSLADRAIAVGISAHEGQLFGWANQALGIFTATGLILISISALVMWWKRRAPGVLGAPPALRATRLPRALIGLVTALAVVLPMFGMSLLLVLGIEYALLRRHAALRRFFGLATSA